MFLTPVAASLTLALFLDVVESMAQMTAHGGEEDYGNSARNDEFNGRLVREREA